MMKNVKAVLSVFAVLVIAVTLMAASNPKTTGDSGWINSPGSYNQQAHTVFNAIAVKPTGLDAKGSVLYSDPNITYSADVKFIRVAGKDAWFAALVTTVQGTICCAVGNWVFYKIEDNGEPGIGADVIWGEDL